MNRTPNEADAFISSIESLAEDAERGSVHAAKEARADDVHPNDAHAFDEEGDELGYIGHELRALASRLYGEIVMGKKGRAA